MLDINNFKIQWFPGHMTKARRMMEAQIKLVDIVIEMLDARIPVSSSNPVFIEIIGNKPKIIVLNKVDLADANELQKLIEKFKARDIPVVCLNSVNGGDYKKLITMIKQVAKPMLDKWLKRGVKNKSIRVMIAGIPNVGKSSLINRLIGKAKTKTGDKPGVTRGQQWLSIADNIELLDTPGILWPKFEDSQVGFALAVTGAIKDNVFDVEYAVHLLLMRLATKYPQALQARYEITAEQLEDVQAMIAQIAHKRGCIRAGGVADTEKVIQLVLREYRDGKIGKIVLDEI